MSSISAVGGSGDAWSAMRSQMQARMFGKADSNGDGSVSKSELDGMLSDIDKATGQDLSSNVDKAFKQMDADGDGKLSSDELAKGMQSLMPPPSTMNFAQGFNAGSSGSSANASSTDAQTALQTLLTAIQSAVQPGEASKSSTSSGMSSDDFANMVKQLYSQFASSMSQSAQGSLSAIA